MEKNKAVLKHCIKPAFFLSSFLRKEAKKNLEKLPDLEGSAPTFLTWGLLAT